MRFIKSFSRPSTTVVVVAALAALVAASGTAFAAKLITGSQIANSTIESRHLKASSVTGSDIAPNAIDSSDIKPGSVSVNDLTRGAATALDGKDGAQGPKGDTGATGATGAKGDAGSNGAKGDTGAKGDKGDNGADGVAASLAGSFIDDNRVIASIGGPFILNATTSGTFTLGAGTYLINGSAFFDRLNNTLPSTPVLMLALRGPAVVGNQFGADFGTAFTGQFPSTGNLEQTATTTRIVTLTASTVVTVKVFGYNADQSGTGSGNYDADVQVSAVKVA